MACISNARIRRWRAFAAASLMGATAVACTVPEPRSTAAEAEAFIAGAEASLLGLWTAARRAAWVHERFATEDTAAITADARRRRLDGTAELAHAASRFDGVELGTSLRRKLLLLRTSLPAVGPAAPELRQELWDVLAGIERAYDRGAACTAQGGACLDRPALERLFAESRETDERLDAWLGWRRSAAPGRSAYRRFVELANAGALELGFADTGLLWRAAYDLPPDALAAELDRIWTELRPLYGSLHCLVRARLGETYGTAVAPPDEAIPAHLLGSPWGGRWDALYDLVRPRERDLREELTRSLERRRLPAAEMVRLGERFFQSLGFDPLPGSFRERSRLVGPTDPDLACRPGAWQIDAGSDVRLRACVAGTGDDLVTAHELLGRTHYQWAFRLQDPLFRSGPAAGGFEVGVAGAIGLSMTPEYFVRAGVLERRPAGDDIGVLLRRALETLAYVPFGLAVDRWRWGVFSGEVGVEAYNRAWWELRRRYQGVGPTEPRSDAAFDPGAAAAVAWNRPSTPGVIGRILQFQLHRSLCEEAGDTRALHRCSVFESPGAGARLRAMMELGASVPWPEALESLTGTRALDAGAMLGYFAPLAAWLDAQNEGRACGWPDVAIRSDRGRSAAPPA
ncbi:MAG: M2 family metallopeptidase [Acidobacteria bacterium]|nr:M2 family metallopeptidase [Acidobacteriota bacterium]